MKKDDEDIKKLPFKKADIILLAFFILIALILILSGLFYKNGAEALWVRIYRDGEQILEYPIESEVTKEIAAYDSIGKNVVTIQDKKVCVSTADCPGQDCVKKGKISQSGEEIICLPHKLVIRIEGGEGIDALAY